VIMGFELFVDLFYREAVDGGDRESIYKQTGVWSTYICFYLLVHLLAAWLPGLQPRVETFEQTRERSFDMDL